MPRQQRFSNPSERISRKLSRILRHKAEEEGFKLMKGGFLFVDDLLRHRDFPGVTEAQVREIVETNDKQRFTLEADEETGRLKIRANQGHSLQIEDLELQPITDASQFPVVVHGTNEKAFSIIQKEGLKVMGRNHIHFAPGEPGETGVISGMRNSCKVVIYLNLHNALRDGIKFFLSSNNVILSPGNTEGVIGPQYFDKVKNKRSGKTTKTEDPAHSKQLALERLREKETQRNQEENVEHKTNQSVPPESRASTEENLTPEEASTSTTANTTDMAAPVSLSTVSADDLADEMDRQKKSKKKKNKNS